MNGKYNVLKLRALTAFENRGWLSPRSWAVVARFTPARAAYSYLKRLYRSQLLERGFDQRGLLYYRLSERGANRLAWLRDTLAAGGFSK
jgi:hypothetical protein